MSLLSQHDPESHCPGTKDPKQAVAAAITRDHTLTLHSCASGSMYAWQEIVGGPAKIERQFLHNRDHVSHYQDVEGVDLDEDGFGFVWTKDTVYRIAPRADLQHGLPRDPIYGSVIVLPRTPAL